MKNTNLNTLSEKDTYSLILFALYKLKDDSKYSTLSELAYLLDKDSLFNLLEYYGGLTIKIPTVYEFKTIINALLLFNYIKLENLEFDVAIKKLNKNTYKKEDIIEAYKKVCEVLANYEFGVK